MAGQPPKKGERNFSPYQQKVIRRYYQNLPDLREQRLAELVGDLYLAEGKRKAQLWKQVAELLAQLGVHANRIAHLAKEGKPELVAEVVKELEGKR